MKILFVIPSYEPAWHLGGVVRSQSLLCKGLKNLGADVTVYSTDSGIHRRLDVPVNQVQDVAGVKVIYFNTDWNLKYFYSRRLAKALRDNVRNYNIIHIVSFWCFPGLIASWEARRQKVPYVMAPHGVFMPYSLHRKYLRKFLYLKIFEYKNIQFSSAIRYTTELERKESSCLRFPVPSFIVPNSIDCSEFDTLSERQDALKRLGLPKNELILVYMGRIHAQKALDVLILSFASVIKKLGNISLALAGPDDGYESQLKSTIRRLGVGNKVYFLGFVDAQRRKDLFSAADLLTLVSPSENFGMSAVEAMAAGVPVLVSDQVGISDFVEKDKAGRVVPLKNEAITNALIQMLSDPIALKAMGNAGYECVRKRFGINNVAKQLLIAFEDVLTGRRSPDVKWQ
jgi:glycosyltransferase involved in cell wall biosynthesis